MLFTIKAYQSETASQRSPLWFVERVICLQKDHFLF